MSRNSDRRGFLKSGLVATAAIVTAGSIMNPKSVLAQGSPGGQTQEKPTGAVSKEASASYEVPAVYFTKPGPSNTGTVLECVRRRLEQLKVEAVLVASVSGQTALKAREVLKPETKIIAVSHVAGFKEPSSQEMPPEARQELISKGVPVLTAQHALGGVGRGIRNKLKTYQVDEIIAYTLRLFGQGTKVGVEIALMAADAGLVRTDQDVITVAGTSKGADTALVIRPANSSDFLTLVVKEIICKPVAI